MLDELKKQSWAHTHSLSVTVTNGVVDLWGYAKSGEERKAIRVAAEAIPGVTVVNDHLAVRLNVCLLIQVVHQAAACPLPAAPEERKGANCSAIAERSDTGPSPKRFQSAYP